MSRPTLNELALFAAVATHCSFRKAADELGVSRSSLSHAIRSLEETLGVCLLNRTTRSVALTEAGRRLRTGLEPVLSGLDDALDAVADARGAPAGTLRINANKGAAELFLRMIVPRFMTLYPEVELDLVVEGQLVDIVEDGFDAGIRLAEAVPQDMIAVPLGGEVRFVTVASPAYLAHHAPLQTPHDLRLHHCIRQRLPGGKRYRWEFTRHGENMTLDVPGVLTLNDSDLMVEAAGKDLGVAYVPESFAHRLLADGRLVTVLDAWCPPCPGLMLYYPRNRHVPSALRALINLMKETNRKLSG